MNWTPSSAHTLFNELQRIFLKSSHFKQHTNHANWSEKALISSCVCLHVCVRVITHFLKWSHFIGGSMVATGHHQSPRHPTFYIAFCAHKHWAPAEPLIKSLFLLSNAAAWEYVENHSGAFRTCGCVSLQTRSHLTESHTRGSCCGSKRNRSDRHRSKTSRF